MTTNSIQVIFGIVVNDVLIIEKKNAMQMFDLRSKPEIFI